MNQFDVAMEKQHLYYGRKHVHLLFRVLTLAVTVLTNRLDIRNFNFVHTL
jgi:hypothetical protein